MKLVSRSEWGARPFKCSEPAPPIDGVVIHYTAANADEQTDHAACASRVRGIQNYHMDSRNYCDVAYNFLFCKHGYIFVGRGWNRKSGATGDANSHTIALCFLGNDTEGRSDITRAGKRAMIQWVRAAQERFGDSVTVKGHRDYMVTACPGDELYRIIQQEPWNYYPQYQLVISNEVVARAKRLAGVLKRVGIMRTALRAGKRVIIRRRMVKR